MLEDALNGIDHEVDAAKAELEAAQQHYDEVVASVAKHKKNLEDKIKALMAS